MESENTKMVTAIGSVFMTPKNAMKKQCLMHGAPRKQVDEDVMPYSPEPEYTAPCVANKCMNWREYGSLGFCDISIPSSVRELMLEEYLVR